MCPAPHWGVRLPMTFKVEPAAPCRDSNAFPAARTLPLVLEPTASGLAVQPVTVGLPLERGALVDPGKIDLRDPAGRGVPSQGQALARWSDGSVRWLLLDFLAALPGPARQEWALHLGRRGPLAERAVTVARTPAAVVIDTDVARFTLCAATLAL